MADRARQKVVEKELEELVTKYDEWLRYYNLQDLFLKGIPIELTESSLATTLLRVKLENESLLCHSISEEEFDIAGCVYWLPDKTAAVLIKG